MNEQIKTLMDQTLDEKFSGTWSTMDMQDLTKFTERFAELIVQECAAEADKQTIYCKGIPWGKWVKQHFGVEQ
jgi:hypothetical protein